MAPPTVYKVNYYKVLQVERTASSDELNKAYKTLALKRHPDKNPEKMGATEDFQLLKQAYDVLIDPIQRRQFNKAFFPPAFEGLSAATMYWQASAGYKFPNAATSYPRSTPPQYAKPQADAKRAASTSSAQPKADAQKPADSKRAASGPTRGQPSTPKYDSEPPPSMWGSGSSTRAQSSGYRDSQPDVEDFDWARWTGDDSQDDSPPHSPQPKEEGANKQGGISFYLDDHGVRCMAIDLTPQMMERGRLEMLIQECDDRQAEKVNTRLFNNYAAKLRRENRDALDLSESDMKELWKQSSEGAATAKLWKSRRAKHFKRAFPELLNEDRSLPEKWDGLWNVFVNEELATLEAGRQHPYGSEAYNAQRADHQKLWDKHHETLALHDSSQQLKKMWEVVADQRKKCSEFEDYIITSQKPQADTSLRQRSDESKRLASFRERMNRAEETRKRDQEKKENEETLLAMKEKLAEAEAKYEALYKAKKESNRLAKGKGKGKEASSIPRENGTFEASPRDHMTNKDMAESLRANAELLAGGDPFDVNAKEHSSSNAFKTRSTSGTSGLTPIKEEVAEETKVWRGNGANPNRAPRDPFKSVERAAFEARRAEKGVPRFASIGAAMGRMSLTEEQKRGAVIERKRRQDEYKKMAESNGDPFSESTPERDARLQKARRKAEEVSLAEEILAEEMRQWKAAVEKEAEEAAEKVQRAKRDLAKRGYPGKGGYGRPGQFR